MSNEPTTPEEGDEGEEETEEEPASMPDPGPNEPTAVPTTDPPAPDVAPSFDPTPRLPDGAEIPETPAEVQTTSQPPPVQDYQSP